MSFSAEWLALREKYDARARNSSVLDTLIAFLADKHALRVVDLACGTGSTLRAVASKITVSQHWQLVDNNLSLLARASEMKPPLGVTFSTTPIDIGYDLEAALDGPVDLVTTSALLDLVSEPWLERLVTEIGARQIPFYAALSYDGRAEMSPPHARDAAILEAVNLHQRGDKGFGPALGSTAAKTAIVGFDSLGYSVVNGTADWVFDRADREIQREVFSGWANAMREVGDMPLADIVEWLTFRRDEIAAGRSSLRVGHVDFFARPTGSR
ncbi:MAG: class I SAM-dependent methyltransferase [Methylobacteriaceae bacterium]|nr:class I SAM-dependent methyltransferase [Methylobacteriaceae bacterium]